MKKKKKSSPLLTERMGAAIRRSLCRMHAAKVMRSIQKRGMGLPASLNFCHYYFRGSFDVFFPPRPYRTARKHWGNFLSWLKYGTGRRFEKRCTPWVNVAMKSLRRCKDCRAASKNRKGRKKRCIRNKRSNEMYEADDVAMMKLLVPLIKKWPSPKPKKKKSLNGVQVKEELHVKEELVDDGPPRFGEI